jgi:hypothetical protein
MTVPRRTHREHDGFTAVHCDADHLFHSRCRPQLSGFLSDHGFAPHSHSPPNPADELLTFGLLADCRTNPHRLPQDRRVSASIMGPIGALSAGSASASASTQERYRRYRAVDEDSAVADFGRVDAAIPYGSGRRRHRGECCGSVVTHCGDRQTRIPSGGDGVGTRQVGLEPTIKSPFLRQFPRNSSHVVAQRVAR